MLRCRTCTVVHETVRLAKRPVEKLSSSPSGSTTVFICQLLPELVVELCDGDGVHDVHRHDLSDQRWLPPAAMIPFLTTTTTPAMFSCSCARTSSRLCCLLGSLTWTSSWPPWAAGLPWTSSVAQQDYPVADREPGLCDRGLATWCRLPRPGLQQCTHLGLAPLLTATVEVLHRPDQSCQLRRLG